MLWVLYRSLLAFLLAFGYASLGLDMESNIETEHYRTAIIFGWIGNSQHFLHQVVGIKGPSPRATLDAIVMGPWRHA